MLCQISGFALSFFPLQKPAPEARSRGPLQKIDLIDGVVEAYALAVMEGGDTECDGKMGFAGAGFANQDQVVRCFQIVALGQLLDAGTVRGGFAPIKTGQIRWIGKRAAFNW